MTCKISLFSSIRETIKHHMASVFVTCIAFFSQFIIFFLNVQNVDKYLQTNPSLILERISEITAPNGNYAIPAVLTAIVLAFDFFRYLHSKKQVDFYDSLPMKRKHWFVLRISSAFFIFLVPYLICTLLEIFLLLALGFTEALFFVNLFWNSVCMILIFTVTLFTGVLAMIMTGHPVIAFCGFCVFCGYAPILLRYLFPVYANEYFATYVGDSQNLHYMNFFSPIGLAYKLLNSYYGEWILADHWKDFAIIIVMSIAVGMISYYLYLKRPSEAAGRAMAFEKWNPIIRILLVIPIALYLGICLSLVAAYGNLIWMIFGFMLGAVIVHGIIESIFQFDIRGLWMHKRQMILCFAAAMLFACVFWFDLLKYDEYTPKLNELEKISITLNGYYYSDSSNADGISGEYLDDALLLAENIVMQDQTIDSGNVESVLFTYHLKNGSAKERRYYMNTDMNQSLIDKVFATKEFKNDICQLYTEDWSNISYIEWDDTITNTPLYMTESELANLFETYIAEFTPLTYSQVRSEVPIGSFIIRYKNDESYFGFSCQVYSDFTQTIALLNDYVMSDENLSDYGNITTSILEKYAIRQLEIYMDKDMLTITDSDVILAFRDKMTLSNDFYQKYPNYNYEDYYDISVSLTTDSGIQYTSAVIDKETADQIIESLTDF